MNLYLRRSRRVKDLETSNRHLVARRSHLDRKSTRLNSSHGYISYAVFCLKKKTRHKLRIATDVDFFNYTNAASIFDSTLNSRWNRCWSTTFALHDIQPICASAATFARNLT